MIRDFFLSPHQVNMVELKRSGMDLPPPPKQEEFPKRELGVRIEATFQHKTGLRRMSSKSTENQQHEASPTPQPTPSPKKNKGMFFVFSLQNTLCDSVILYFCFFSSPDSISLSLSLIIISS